MATDYKKFVNGLIKDKYCSTDTDDFLSTLRLAEYPAIDNPEVMVTDNDEFMMLIKDKYLLNQEDSEFVLQSLIKHQRPFEGNSITLHECKALDELFNILEENYMPTICPSILYDREQHSDVERTIMQTMPDHIKGSLPNDPVIANQLISQIASHFDEQFSPPKAIKCPQRLNLLIQFFNDNWCQLHENINNEYNSVTHGYD